MIYFAGNPAQNAVTVPSGAHMKPKMTAISPAEKAKATAQVTSRFVSGAISETIPMRTAIMGNVKTEAPKVAEKFAIMNLTSFLTGFTLYASVLSNIPSRAAYIRPVNSTMPSVAANVSCRPRSVAE